MNQNSPASPAENDAAVEQTQRQKVDPRALAVALAGIRADSQRDTQSYLRDTVVPHGGE